MLERADSYDDLRRAFRWRIPERFNIGVACADAWAADDGRVALIHRTPEGPAERYSFLRLKRLSNKLANALRARGIGAGDRVAILLGQAPETAVAHLAVYKLGAIALPLFTLFQEEALAYRLADSGARAVVTDAEGVAKVATLRDRLPELDLLLSIDGAEMGALDLHEEMERASDTLRPADTAPDDPALIIYTSGTTGPPKGALHAHRTLLGHLPGVEMPQEFFPQPGDLFWTPADWAWIGGLLDVLLPSLVHGVPVLTYRFPKFDPEEAFHVMARFGVRNAFMPPTALKMMRQVERPADRYGLNVRSIGCGGETLGAGLLEWGRETFGITVNEFYGQTECNLVVSNCASIMDVRPGAMGRAVPGHEVAVVDPEGNPVPVGEPGVVAVRHPDPVMFLEYWNKPEATRGKFAGDWLLTGDMARLDGDGYFWFLGREDDVISSGGYRIGPGEVEDCLIKHPAVALAAVVGVPDEMRGERVKAFVVLTSGHRPGERLAREIQEHVKTRLAAHEYPREVEFVPTLPMTATGKIKRKDLREHGAGALETGEA